MRLRLEVATSATELPWPRVLAPGRGLAYGLLAEAAPALGRQLHEVGWGRHRMVPFGFRPPTFPDARRRRGVYAVGGRGFLELCSPLSTVIEAWSRALRGRDVLDWGGMALRLIAVRLLEPPQFTGGRVRVRTETPVVLKSSPQQQPHPQQVLPSRPPRQLRPLWQASSRSNGGQVRRSWLLPAEAEFPASMQYNLRRKAETLGLPCEVELEAVTWAGPKRSFVDGGGAKPGAEVEVELSGAPAVLQAIWSWGLGQSNAAGFGWIGSAR